HAKETAFSLHPIEFKLLTQIGSQLEQLVTYLGSGKEVKELSAQEKLQIRSQIYGLEKSIKKLEKIQSPVTLLPEWKRISEIKKVALRATDYAPYWVLLIVALSLGIGTMVGWKRIVVTIGENIGKSHLTYAQGASAELVAMSTIGLSALLGVPVSTTHVLSSGIAGTMVASKTGVHFGVIKKILMAWVMTLPATILLSSGLYLCFHWVVSRAN
ncbi:MAG: inorganic phosphate transporter, partial [Bdellovibrionales bacterium]|nr:inorganic phosphate transporter [Bdellovibrionales bacterium]